MPIVAMFVYVVVLFLFILLACISIFMHYMLLISAILQAYCCFSFNRPNVNHNMYSAYHSLSLNIYNGDVHITYLGSLRLSQFVCVMYILITLYIFLYQG